MPVSTLRSGPAAGTGLATVAADGVVLDAWYPAPVLDDDAPDVPELETPGVVVKRLWRAFARR